MCFCQYYWKCIITNLRAFCRKSRTGRNTRRPLSWCRQGQTNNLITAIQHEEKLTYLFLWDANILRFSQKIWKKHRFFEWLKTIWKLIPHIRYINCFASNCLCTKSIFHILKWINGSSASSAVSNFLLRAITPIWAAAGSPQSKNRLLAKPVSSLRCKNRFQFNQKTIESKSHSLEVLCRFGDQKWRESGRYSFLQHLFQSFVLCFLVANQYILHWFPIICAIISDMESV